MGPGIKDKRMVSVIAAVIMIAMATLYLVTQSKSTPTTANSSPVEPTYSFTAPGQTVEEASASETNRYQNMTAEELEQAAQAIMSDTDLIMQENPVTHEPLDESQQQALSQRLSELDEQIKSMEKGLEQQ